MALWIPGTGLCPAPTAGSENRKASAFRRPDHGTREVWPQDCHGLPGQLLQDGPAQRCQGVVAGHGEQAWTRGAGRESWQEAAAAQDSGGSLGYPRTWVVWRRGDPGRGGRAGPRGTASTTCEGLLFPMGPKAIRGWGVEVAGSGLQ